MIGVAVVEKRDRRLMLQDEIRQRLGTICSNLEKEDFEVLVEKIADNAIKSDVRGFRGPNSEAVLPGK
jgi:hypothetical protein